MGLELDEVQAGLLDDLDAEFLASSRARFVLDVCQAVLPQTTALLASGCDLNLLLVSPKVSPRPCYAVERVQQLSENCQALI
jgi:hypothetical protein